MNDDFKFWCVWCPQGGTPTVKHADEDIARGEAERLALTNPGKAFYVLEAKSYCQKETVQWVKLKKDKSGWEPPF